VAAGHADQQRHQPDPSVPGRSETACFHRFAHLCTTWGSLRQDKNRVARIKRLMANENSPRPGRCVGPDGRIDCWRVATNPSLRTANSIVTNSHLTNEFCPGHTATVIGSGVLTTCRRNVPECGPIKRRRQPGGLSQYLTRWDIIGRQITARFQQLLENTTFCGPFQLPT
jgi:hypothetical protein